MHDSDLLGIVLLLAFRQKVPKRLRVSAESSWGWSRAYVFYYGKGFKLPPLQLSETRLLGEGKAQVSEF